MSEHSYQPKALAQGIDLQPLQCWRCGAAIQFTRTPLVPAVQCP
jgi:hypothetical protein